MSYTPTILIVEDKPSEREALARLLRLEDYHTLTAASPRDALEHLEDRIDLVISDLRMGTSSGLDLLQQWKKQRPRTPFVLITAFGEVDSAVEAMKQGAEDYLSKPVNPDELLMLVRRCLESVRKDETIEQLQQRLDNRLGFEKLIGNSRAILQVFDQARRAAAVDSTVLILGESGTGKELIAEAVHQNSPRKNAPFVTVNMAAVPEHLVESELFGHVKGAFTGAIDARVGRFEAAHGGTLFIDEIGDFAPASQAKLLRVLETHVVTPVGSNDDREVNVRVLAATSRNLPEMVADDEFREDLYYRLNVITLSLPPLRDRPEDIPLLVDHFIKQLCEQTQRDPLQVDPDLMHYFETFPWPGNVRQLKNCLESMVVMATGDKLTRNELPAQLSESAQASDDVAIPTGTSLEDLERVAVEKALEQFDDNRTRAAESLGISVRTLQRKLKAWHAEDEARNHASNNASPKGGGVASGKPR